MTRGRDVEMWPPYYTFAASKEAGWTPFKADVIDGLDIKGGATSVDVATSADVSWPDAMDIPACLVRPFTQSLACKLMDESNQVLCDYGADAYWRRSSGACGRGKNHQTISLIHIAVGKKWPQCVGSQPQSVVFQYDATSNRVRPIFCEYREERQPKLSVS